MSKFKKIINRNGGIIIKNWIKLYPNLDVCCDDNLKNYYKQYMDEHFDGYYTYFSQTFGVACIYIENKNDAIKLKLASPNNDWLDTI